MWNWTEKAMNLDVLQMKWAGKKKVRQRKIGLDPRSMLSSISNSTYTQTQKRKQAKKKGDEDLLLKLPDFWCFPKEKKVTQRKRNQISYQVLTLIHIHTNPKRKIPKEKGDFPLWCILMHFLY